MKKVLKYLGIGIFLLFAAGIILRSEGLREIAFRIALQAHRCKIEKHPSRWEQHCHPIKILCYPDLHLTLTYAY